MLGEVITQKESKYLPDKLKRKDTFKIKAKGIYTKIDQKEWAE